MRTMTVIGTGLIGTSIALAASGQGLTVFLSDRDPLAARTAAALGAGLVRTPTEPVDLAVLAVPPSQVGTVLAELQRRGLANSYTDVASVKSEPERAALSRAPDPTRYIGGHPLAGRERSGPLAARADLFQGRPWVLTPSGLTSNAAMRRALELVTLCGGVPFVTQSQVHDDAVALTSHVPHLVASLMAARLAEGPDGISRFAGQGLRDVTRIAGGDSLLWGDILQANAGSIIGVVKDLHADLSRLVPALDILADPEAGGRADAMRTLVDLLDRGVTGLAGIPGGRPGASDEDPRVRVTVLDCPGELSRLLGDLAEFGVCADDASVDGSVVESAGTGEGSALTVRFAVGPGAAERVVVELRSKGWDADRENNAPSGWYGENASLPIVRI